MRASLNRHIWEDEYRKALKNLPKNQWIVHLNGNLNNEEFELSCVHTSVPHGLISWGWIGRKKFLIADIETYDGKVPKVKRVGLMKLANEICDMLNIYFPRGL